MKRILVSGSLSFDRIMNFPGLFKEHFLPEGLHNINVSFAVGAPRIEQGGCAGNVAYTLALLETPADIAGVAGSDFAPYKAVLTTLGVGTETVQLHDSLPTSSAYIMTDKADNQITAFSEGAGGTTYTMPVDFSQYELVIIGPGAVSSMEGMAQAAKEAGVPYLFDPGQQIPALSPETLKACISGSAAVFLNDYELSLVLEKTGMSEDELVSQTGFLLVTYGSEGSRIQTTEGEERIAAVPAVSIVDPTGAGDAYRAGFIAAHVRGLSPQICAQVASAVAVHAVECYGTQNHRFTTESLAARYEATYRQSFPF